MALTLFIVSLLLVSQAQAQYSWSIPCRTAMQCASILGTSSQGPQSYECSQGYCLCANMTTGKYEMCSNKDMILTARASGLRRNCTSHDDCSLVNGANCLPKDPKDKSSKICLCQPDRVESDDGQSCLSVVSVIGGLCNEHLQCISRLSDGAECFNHQCRCRPTHHYKKPKCIRKLGFGDTCNIDEDGCYELDATGEDNLMVCTANYGCRCKEHWTYNVQNHHCEFSSASQAAIHFVTLSALISLIAFF